MDLIGRSAGYHGDGWKMLLGLSCLGPVASMKLKKEG